MAPSTVYRALKRHGWRKGIPQNHHPNMVPEKLEEAQKKLRREAMAHGQPTQQSLAVNQAIRLMFMDEARFGRISEIRACWAPHGMRPLNAIKLRVFLPLLAKEGAGGWY